MQLRTIAWICLFAVFLSPAGLLRAVAQDEAASPWEKGSLQLGGFVTTFDSDVTFGASGVGNTSIDAEKLLGLDSTLSVFRVDGMIRPGSSRRHQFDAGYASYDREGDDTLSRELTIDGETFPIGAEVDTDFDFDLIRATYTYAFLQNNRFRVALGLSAYGIPLSYGVKIETDDGLSVVEGADTFLPLPAVAVRAELRLLPKLFLKTAVDGFYLPLENFEGSLVDANLALEYRIWKHFGVGLGYNYTAARVEGKDSDADYPGVDFEGEVDVRFTGLILYGKLAF